MKKGLLIIFSGPSGVGKGTIRESLMKDKSLNLFFSISMTTRKARENEKDGVDYYFVSREVFEKAIKDDEFIEYAEFVGNYYGTPKKTVEKKRNEGKNVILEIETKGAEQVLEKFKNDKGLISIFIVPPNFKELKERIMNRQTENKKDIHNRLKNAKKEIKIGKKYDYIIVNDNVDVAVKKLTDVIIEKMKQE